MAQRSRTKFPALSCASSTSLTLEELMSMPTNGADWRLNKVPTEIKMTPLQRTKIRQQNFTFRTDAISKIVP